MTKALSSKKPTTRSTSMATTAVSPSKKVKRQRDGTTVAAQRSDEAMETTLPDPPLDASVQSASVAHSPATATASVDELTDRQLPPAGTALKRSQVQAYGWPLPEKERDQFTYRC